MKKMLIVFCLLFLFSGLIPLVSSASYSNAIGIEVRMNDHEPLSNGFFDILIPSSYFVNGINHLSITQTYMDEHLNYEEYSYLESQSWISYLAYFEDAEVFEERYPSKYVFYGHGDPLYNVSTFKIVRISDAGDVVSESEIISMPSLTPFVKRDIVVNYYSITDYFKVESLVSERFLLIIFIWFFGFIYLFIHFVHRFLILNWVKTERTSEKKILLFHLITTIPSALVMVQAVTEYPIFPNDYYLLLILFGIILFETCGIYLSTPDKIDIKDIIKKNGYSFIPFVLVIVAIVLSRIL